MRLLVCLFLYSSTFLQVYSTQQATAHNRRVNMALATNVKVKFDDEVRRIILQPPYEFKTLLREVASRFNLNHEIIALDKYGEWTTSDEDLRRAVSSSASSSCLRVELSIKKPSPGVQTRKGEPSFVLPTQVADRSPAFKRQGEISIKASIEGGELRKFSFDLPVSLAKLETEIATELRLQGTPASMKFVYIDEDEETVTVKTDHELQLACKPGCTGHRITFSINPELQTFQGKPGDNMVRHHDPTATLPCPAIMLFPECYLPPHPIIPIPGSSRPFLSI